MSRQPLEGFVSQVALPSPHSGTESLPERLDLRMLHGAQEHLRCRLARQESPQHAEEEWQRFYKTYDHLVRRYVLAHALPKGDVEDCLQDVWNEILRTLVTFDSDGTHARLCSWLHTVVHSKATNSLHRRTTRAWKQLGTRAEAGLASRENGPVEDYDRHCLQETVQRVLELLRGRVPALTYCVFVKHWIEKKRIKTIAAELQVTERVVRRRVCKGKRAFVGLCEEDQEKDSLTDVDCA